MYLCYVTRLSPGFRHLSIKSGNKLATVAFLAMCVKCHGEFDFYARRLVHYFNVKHGIVPVSSGDAEDVAAESARSAARYVLIMQCYPCVDTGDGRGRVLGGQGRVLGGQGRVLGGQGRVLGGQERVLGGQGRVLGGQGRVLGGQGRVLGGQGRVLGGQGRVLGGQGRVLGGKEGWSWVRSNMLSFFFFCFLFFTF